jgi:uncharacterized membrane protein
VCNFSVGSEVILINNLLLNLLLNLLFLQQIGRGFKININCINQLNAELNPICCLLALLGAQNFLHVSRIRVKIASK